MDDIRIRPGAWADLDAIRALYDRYILSGVATFDLEPRSREDRERWFARFAEQGAHRIFVADHAARGVLGYACSGPFKDKAAYDSSVEVSIYLEPSAQGRGLGGRLYGALFRALLATDLHRAYAGITRPNPASVALHLRQGFRLAGSFREVGFKFGAYHDVDWYELELDRLRLEG
ncbi:MAG: N-acetyltransferase [Planctomycetes bacterium]|nr:N-acetyltransferase [Planctomycetota bacterium]